MREQLRVALQRKREAAERDGLTDRVAAIDARLAEAGEPEAETETESQEPEVNMTAAAQRKADELGLTADDFKRRRPSGASGFTVSDVERIAEARGEANPNDEGDD